MKKTYVCPASVLFSAVEEDLIRTSGLSNLGSGSGDYADWNIQNI